jgi:outer membrane protein
MRKTLRLPVVILAIVAVALGALPTRARAEDLLDIYRLAVKNDAQIQQAQAQDLAAREATPQSRAGLLPSINLSANVTEERLDIKSAPLGRSQGVSTFTNKGYTLSLTQPVYRRDRFVRVRQAKASVRQADVTFEAAQQALILRSAQAYFGVLSALDNLEVARGQKAAIGRQLEQSQQRFQVGLIAITDVQDAQARYDLAASQEIAAENQLATARESLRELTGTYAKELAILGKEIPLVTPQPADIDAWTNTALKENPALLAAQYAADVAQEQIEVQRSGHYPTLDIVADHTYSDSGGGTLGALTSADSTIGLQFNLPIYQGGLVTSQTRQARYQYDQALSALEAQNRATQRDARNAYLGVMTGISQVRANSQAVKSSEVALEATQAGYQVGTRTAVDLLNAESQLFSARATYAQSRYNYLLATLTLKQAAGMLTAEDLAKINALLAK